GHYDEGRWPADILDARWLALDSHRWERDDEDDRSQLRARVLGGCSAHNACVVLRGAPEDYDEWGPGWSYAELEPYLRRGEETLRVRPTPAEELSPWHRAFAEAGGDDSIPHPLNAVGDVRWHTGFAYVDPARGRPNLTVFADTLVDRVLVEDGRAVGAVAGGRELRAGVVAVSGGGSCPPGVNDLFVFPAIQPGPEISGAVFAMKPLSRGSVRLNGPRPETPLAIDHGFLREERDVEVLAEGFEALREMVASEPVARY